MIKTLILDLGNVLLRVEYSRLHGALAAVCRYSPEEIPERVRSTRLFHRFETGQVSTSGFYQEMSEALELKMGYPEFGELWSDIFAPEPIIPESLIEALGRERRLVLLSNTNVFHFEAARQRFPLLRHFHSFVLSYEVGAMKPSPSIYQEAIARSGCLPEECFFTDDMAPFVEGARREGIDAVQFHSLEQFQDELRARSIQW